MKIKYLGTGASEGIPALFCECDTCKKAKELKGKNIRSRSQIIINDDLLIDYPPDSFYHFNLYNINLAKIKNILITHDHEDHFYPLDFLYFKKGYSLPKECLPLTIFGSADLKRHLNPILQSECNQGLFYVGLEPFNKYKIGRYMVIPLPATHGTNNPFIYIISDGDKKVLYCHDTGLLKDEIYAFLEKERLYFDLISLDCNNGNSDFTWDSHMNIATNKLVVKKLNEIGAINQETKIVISHFSHNGMDVLYDDMVDVVKDYKFIVACDGLEIDF